MKINWEHTRNIERYLDNEMTNEERIGFEAEISRDATLRKEIEFHTHLRAQIEELGERTRLKRKMNTWHDDKKSAAGVKRFTRISWRTVSVAASISLIIVAGGLTAYHFINQRALDNNIKMNLAAIEEATNRQMPPIAANSEETETVLPTNLATAFAISNKGHLLTAFHVVAGKQEVTVEQFGANPVSFKARVVRVDEVLDIAVLKIEDTLFNGFSQIPFAIASKPCELAEKIYSVGYPMKKDLVFSEGSVSGLTGYKSDTASCQVNLIANPGNSGSPVMNEKGELVGVLLSKNAQTDGETFVTRTDYLRGFLEEMSKQKKFESFNLNKRSSLKGMSISNQVKSVSPYIFIVRTK